MPTVHELIAHNKTEDETAEIIGADWLIYQDLDQLINVVRAGNPGITEFDLSCFDGKYVTGDINEDYLNHIEELRNDNAKMQNEEEEEESDQEENLIDL
jgi:amidophosphoribosyltransferase